MTENEKQNYIKRVVQDSIELKKNSNEYDRFILSSKIAYGLEQIGEIGNAKEVALEMKESHFDEGQMLRMRKLEPNKKMMYYTALTTGLDVGARLGDFDSFCLALEMNRPVANRFYYPRRDRLIDLKIISDLQDLSEGKLDLLSISMPQRTGKSRIGLFFITFLLLKDADMQKQIFGTGHSNGLVRTFYEEVLSYLKPSSKGGEYRAVDIFNTHRVVKTNVDNLTIDLDVVKGMPNLAFRSIEGTITGAVEGGRLMYADDLIKDSNEVINKEISDTRWRAFNVLVLGRMKENVPLLMMGTKWGLNCPISRLEQSYTSEEAKRLLKESGVGEVRTRFRSISCYDENGESNFKYKYGVGFNTEYYKKLELTLKKSDSALWHAMYLAKPIDRLASPFEDLVFYKKGEQPETDNWYYGSAIDVATSVGGDYWSFVIGKFYPEEREVYIEDVVYTNKGASYNLPLTAEMLMSYNIESCEIEEKESVDKLGLRTGIGAKLNEILEKREYKMFIHSHSAAGLANKRARILAYRDEILGIQTDYGWTVKFNQERYEKNKMYKDFIENIKAWKETDAAQKHQHDDAIDSLAQLLRQYINKGNRQVVRDDVSLKMLGL